MLRNIANTASKTAFVALLSVLLAGCQSGTAGYDNPEPESGLELTGQAHEKPNSSGSSPQKTYNATQTGKVPVENAVADNDVPKTDAAGAKMESTSAGGGTPSATVKPANPANKDSAGWDRETPKLCGIGLNDNFAVLSRQLGKPADSYTFEDEKETLSVYEYSGFAVGFGSDDKVRFVEVFDKNASPGLNGLLLGDSADAAVKALGNPDSRTTSVLAYKAAGTLLKLDLDPANDSIVSVKLFHEAGNP